MKNFLYALGAVIVSVGFSFAFLGHQVEQKLGTYTPNLPSYLPGFTNSFSTSTALSASTFCANNQNMQFVGQSAVATGTLAAATTSYVACNNPNFGTAVNGQITNDGTSSVNLVAGTGDSFLCETSGVGTTTVQGTCTASTVSLNATSTLFYTSYFDSSSSTLKVVIQNMAH